MTFAQAQAYLLSTAGEGFSRSAPHRLDRMRALLRELGDPQDAYPTIHVAGTSGKGSTATLIAAALQAAGRKTGLHSKPHLYSVTERARIGGICIPEVRFAQLLAEMMPAIERTTGAFDRPSYYETLLALAFLYFAAEQVEVAVIEAGLGGTLDGTNVLHPQVCVITNVGFDHMDVLGDTLEEIAANKAGIAKSGVPLVSGVGEPSARHVVVAACAHAGAPFVDVDLVTRIEGVQNRRDVESFTVVTSSARYDLTMTLLGGFQRRNAATALAALERLPAPLRPGKQSVVSGFAAARIQGRMEVVAGRVPVVFDIAHNREKARALVAALAERFPAAPVRYVVAVGQGKDAAGVLRALGEAPGSFLLTAFTAQGRTAQDPHHIGEIARGLGLTAQVVPQASRALAAALDACVPGEIVVVTGSTFLVAELRGEASVAHV
ncbi:MAG: bifunctional folylpolyglutamate synthase/dihydrofolate synthase [Vulcanimicrobiaceae bacterium]